MAATCTITATITDPSGASLLGNALVRFRLRNYTGFVPVVSGTSVLCETQIDAYPNPAGAISQILTCNTAISPINTFYTVEFWNQGRIVTSANYYFNANTSLNTASNINPAPAPAGPSSIIFENNGVLNSSQTLLNLTSTTVTIQDLGNGRIDLEAPSGTLNSSGFTGFAGPGLDSTVYLTGGWDQALISNVPDTILVYGFTLAYSIRITQAVITLINPGEPLGDSVGVFGLFDYLGNLLTQFSADADAVASNIPQVITLSTPVTIGPGFYYQAQAQHKPNGSGTNVNTAFALGNATLSTPMVLTVNALQPVVGIATNTLNGGTTMPSTLGIITPYAISDVIGQIALPLWYS